MPCNYNYNTCYSFQNYPLPIFSCQNINTGSLSSNTIVNPTTSSFISGTITADQTLTANATLVATTNYTTGSAITFSDGTYTLSAGTYRISYSATGTFGANGEFSLAGYLNDTIITNSTASSSGTEGDSTSVSSDFVVVVSEDDSTFTIKNNNTDSEVVTSGNVIIEKIA